jgi:hypothetical protein
VAELIEADLLEGLGARNGLSVLRGMHWTR